MTHLKKLLFATALAAAAIGVGAITTAPTDAHAADRRMTGGTCRDWNSDTYTQRTGRFRNPHIGGVLGVYCDVPSDSLLRHDKIVKINMHGYNSGAMVTRACVQYYNGSGGACGPAIGWDPGNGYKSLTGGYLSTWQSNPYHFPYLHNDVPGLSMIYGWWMYD